MADPLSIAASIVAVVQLSDSVLSYLRSVKDAPKECKKLLLEINYIYGLLDILNQTVTEVGNTADWAGTLGVLARDDSPISSIKAILEPLDTKLKKTAEKPGLVRLAKYIVWPLSKGQTEETVRAVDRQKGLLMIALENDHLLLSAEIKKNTALIRQGVDAVRRDLQSIERNLNAQEREGKLSRALQWLSTLQYQATQTQTYRQRHGNSLNWFLQKQEFLSWVSEADKTLYCPGIPGAGKTVLAATVIHYLQEEFPDDNQDVGIAWVYCNFKARAAQTTTNIIGSICAQLARRREDLSEKLLNLHKSGADDVVVDTDITALLNECHRTYQKIYLVIDALDEYGEEDTAAIELLDIIRRLGPHCNSLFTSRPTASIGREFAEAQRIEIKAHETDVLAYIRSGFERPELLKHTRTDYKFRKYIEDELISKSQGMFLLTKLHLDAICRKARYNKEALSEAVKKLPTELDQTFEDALQRINAQSVDDATLAKQVLAWIHLSFIFLSPRILQQALAKQRGDSPSNENCLIDEQLLVSVCAGLVIINEESQDIRLVHYTVEEYFNRCFDQFYPNAAKDVNYTCLRQAWDSNTLRDLMDARKCLWAREFWPEYNWDYQQKDDEMAINRHYDEVPFSKYAIFHLNAYSKSKDLHKTKVLQQAMDGFDVSAALEEANAILFEPLHSYSSLHMKDYHEGLKLAVFFNDLVEVQRILDSSAGAFLEDPLSSCLAYAALRGYDNIVQMLLEENADVKQFHEISNEAYGKEPRKLNALGCAIEGRRTSTVKILLSKHMDLIDLPIENRHDSSNVHVTRTALELVLDLKGEDSRSNTELEAIERVLRMHEQTRIQASIGLYLYSRVFQTSILILASILMSILIIYY